MPNEKTEISEDVKNFLLSSVGFDGGDLGSPDNQSIWLCGIEWGGGYKTEDSFISDINNQNYIPLDKIENFSNYEDKDYQVNNCDYNKRATKLLSYIFGYKNYLEFNDIFKPFVKNEKGFFKMNLLPIAFPTEDAKRKDKGGLLSAINLNLEKYMQFCRDKRFPLLNELKEKYEPKIIICVGRNTRNNFKKAFLDREEKIKLSKIEVRNKEKNVYADFYYSKINYASGKSGLFVVTGFLGYYRYCLNSNDRLEACGKAIRKIALDNEIELPCPPNSLH